MSIDGLDVSGRGSDSRGALHSPILEQLEPRLLLSGNVFISEFMAINDSTLLDGDANYRDWIEIYNANDAPVSLDGWYLTDKSDNLDKWEFPDITLAASGDPGGNDYLVVFASDENKQDSLGYWHTNFKLAPEDESVLLVRPDGVTIEHGYEDYPEQFSDISYGIYLDGDTLNTLVDEGDKLSYHVPTAGDANLLPIGQGEGEQGWTAVDFDDSTWTDAMVFGPADIVITEVSTDTTKFVEIQNASIASVNNADLTVLVNNASLGINSVNATVWNLPDSIAPGEILYQTDSVGDNYWGAAIDWALEGSGWVMLVDDGAADVEVMDFVAWGYTAAEIASLDISYGGDSHITAGGHWSGDGLDITGGGLPGPVENAVEFGAIWNYMHPLNATDPASSDPDFNTTWTQPIGYDGPAFNNSGPAILGYGGIGLGGVVTHIGEPPSGSRYTAYFRREFTITDDMINAGIEILSDDGGVVYIDGVEVARNNFSLPRQDTYFEFTNGGGNENGTATISIADISAGTHTIAASIHQTGTTSSDIGFDLRLYGQPVSGGGLIRRTGSSDGDSAADFQATSEATKGAQNPGITVPFGVVTDTTTGIGFSDNQQAFEDVLVTDVGDEMQGVNASLWTRIEFPGSDELSAMQTLTLNMMYDDGFVAYLNGVQVAQRSAPGSLAWNSFATAVRPNAIAVVYEEIDITAHLGLLVEEANVLAIHGLNFAAADGDFLIRPTLVAVGDESVPRHFDTATPGQVNTEVWWRYVEDTSFDHDRGFYTDPFHVAITTNTPGAQIYYTTNGTDPLLDDAGNIHPDAALYISPVLINKTTALRAVAVKDGYDPTNTDTHTYIFLEHTLQQPAVPDGFPPDWKGVAPNYNINQSVVNSTPTILDDMRAVPTLSIVTSVEDMFGVTGIYSNPGGRGQAWERPASIEWINTDGSALFQVDGGVQIVGGASRGTGTKKHSFRLVFKGMYGPTTLDYPVFEDTDMDEFNTITLRAGFNDTFWGGTILQDRWAAERQLAAGAISSHGRFVHLYVDGLYWGLYNPLERTDDAFAASYLGGDKDDYDYYTNQGISGGNSTAWNLMHSLANDAVGNYAAIKELLDIPEFCDYLLINQFAHNGDWPHNNWRATYGRDVEGGKWRFHMWDAEFGLRNVNGNNVDSFGGPPGQLFQKMLASPKFVSTFQDRAHRLLFNGGPLTPQVNIDWVTDAAAGIYDAVMGEAARWSGSRANWESRINNLKTNYFPQRTDIFINQLKAVGRYPNVDAPLFNINGSYQHGGIIDLGATLTMDGPGEGTIYYTLDGSDPNSGGTAYTGAPIDLTQGGHVKSRVEHNGQWSALNEATYYVDVSADIRVTEIMYSPSAPTQSEIDAGYGDASDFEYIEIKNISGDTLPLMGLQFNNGIDFTFPAMSIAPGEYVVVVSNEDAFLHRYNGYSGQIAGEFGTGLVVATQLANGGENLELGTAVGGDFQDFTYADGWYDHTDGEGFSLTIRNPEGSLDLWDQADGWRPSAAPGGSPGGDDTLTNPGAIVISEVLAHTDLPQVDTIELRNMTSLPIDVSGWWLSDQKTNDLGVEVLTKYQIPTIPAIGPKGYLVLNESDHFGGDFLLSEHGDDVYLSSDAGGAAGGYREHVDFDGSPNGVSIGLHITSIGETDFTLLRTPFIGLGNSVPYFGDLVINELMYHPANPTTGEINAGYGNDEDLEFIEIYNKSDTTTHTLSNFYIGDGIGFSFGWYDADSGGAESWTLEAGATATWNAVLPAGLESYEVFARWDLLDADGNARDLDEQALYSITHNGGTNAVVRDQKPEDDDEGPGYIDANGWVSLGTYYFDGSGQVVLTRGAAANSDNWTIADQVKFVRAGHSDVIVDNPTLDSWNTANGPTTIGPGEYVVIVSDRDAFNYRYNYAEIVGQDNVAVAGEYSGNLSDSGEKVKLMRAGIPDPSGLIPYYRIDYVNYRDNTPWPEAPDGSGPSLSRKDPYGPSVPFPYGNDPSSWFVGAMHGSPGQANSAADLTAPSVPQNLSAQINTPLAQIELTWDAAEDLETWVEHYIIYRDGANIGTSQSPSYTDTTAESLTPYSYKVRAVNRDGARSARSSEVEITIPGIVSHFTPSDTEIVVIFSEPMVEYSAEDLSNYSFAGGTLQNATLEAGGVTVTLTTSIMTVGQAYSLTIGSPMTLSGTLVPSGEKVSFLYGQTIGDNTPTVSNPIADVNVNEDAAVTVLDLESAPVFSDADAGDSLTYSITGNTNANVVQAAIAAGELHLAYIADQNGASNVTVRATDQSGAWAEDTFTVTVASIGDTPRLATEIDDLTVNEDAADTVLDLADVFYDPDVFYYDATIPGDDDILTLTVSGNTNSGLVTTSVSGDKLTLSYVADQNGTADITVRATDSDGNPIEDTFTVTVNPVNDAPVLLGSLGSIVVQEGADDTVVSFGFTDADVFTNTDFLMFSETGNTNPGLVYFSSPTVLSYVPGKSGTAEITVRATDLAGAWAEDTFTVAVEANGAASVEHVLVKGTAWTDAFLDELDAQGLGSPTLSNMGYRIPDGAAQFDTLPWNNIDTVVVAFSKDISVVQGDLVLYDSGSSPQAIDSFSYDSATFTASWTLTAPIGADRMLIDMSGGPVGTFQLDFNVLPGDADGDETTTAADGIGVRDRLFFSAGDVGYSPHHDLNASGRSDFIDWAIVRSNLGLSLPASAPVAPVSAPAAAPVPLAQAPVADTVDQSASEQIAATPEMLVVSPPVLGVLPSPTPVTDEAATSPADDLLLLTLAESDVEPVSLGSGLDTELADILAEAEAGVFSPLG